MKETAWGRRTTGRAPAVVAGPPRRAEIVEFDLLRPSARSLWDEILQASGSPNIFLTWEWMANWLDLHRAGRQRVLLVRGPGGEVQGLAPLFEVSSPGLFRLRRVRFMGTGFGADHLALISRPGCDIVGDVVNWIAAHHVPWDVIELRWLVQNQAQRLVEVLHSHRHKWAWQMEDADPAPLLRLPSSWEEYLRGLGPNLRASLGRSRRKLERDHERVTFARVERPDELPRTWQALVRLHQARWCSRGELGSFVKPGFEELHRRFAQIALDRGWLRLYFLEVKSQIIAALYCLRYDHRVSYFQAGFDSAWSQHGPGRLLMAHAIRESISEGALEFDFMRGAEEHKMRWKPEICRDTHVTIFLDKARVRTGLWVQEGARWLRRSARNTLLATGVRL
jgi:CelD/BcsL family acetyltransferase involved in cellulose biosynthesis